MNGSDHIKFAYTIVRNNHDFPSNLSSKLSVFNWLKKYDYHSDVIDVFNLAWIEFSSKPYCTIKQKKKMSI